MATIQNFSSVSLSGMGIEWEEIHATVVVTLTDTDISFRVIGLCRDVDAVDARHKKAIQSTELNVTDEIIAYVNKCGLAISKGLTDSEFYSTIQFAVTIGNMFKIEYTST